MKKGRSALRLLVQLNRVRLHPCSLLTPYTAVAVRVQAVLAAPTTLPVLLIATASVLLPAPTLYSLPQRAGLSSWALLLLLASLMFALGSWTRLLL